MKAGESPLATNVLPEDFSGANITRRAAQYLRSIQSSDRWPGFAATSREELEAGMLWQSADELRHYESLLTSTSNRHSEDTQSAGDTQTGQTERQPCGDKPQVSGSLVCCDLDVHTFPYALTPGIFFVAYTCVD